MLGLALESADRTASAALWRSDVEDVGWLGDATLPSDAAKADQLITAVGQLLLEQGLSYADLDVIAVNRGPGSFTGIRSAVALGRGLALAAALPVIGVTSHEALAATLFHNRAHDQVDCPLLVALDARRGEVYAQAFSADGHPISEIEARVPSDLAADLKTGCCRLSGHGAPLIMEALDGQAKVEMIESRSVDAIAVARAAAARLNAGDVPAAGATLRPLYIRAPDAVPPTPLVSKADDLEVLA